MLESEVDQSSEVDGGDAQRKTQLVPLDAAEADPSVPVGHEPGDRPFDHRSPLSVVRDEVPFTPGPSGLDEFRIVGWRWSVRPSFALVHRSGADSSAADAEDGIRVDVIVTV